jgi:exopolysaccharide biosynthesis polyprenyl glycosylphosphotransferase
VLHVLRRRGIDSRDVCVVGDWDTAHRLAARFRSNRHWGMRVTCVGVGTPAERVFVRYPGGEPIAVSLTDVLSREVVDEVVVSSAARDLPAEASTLHACETFGVVGRVLLQGEDVATPKVQEFLGETVLTVCHDRVEGSLLVLKRIFDFGVAAALLVLLSPMLLFIALVIKLSSSGPVIFRQARIGFHGRRFTLLKFRTMIDGAEAQLASAAHRSITGGPVFKDPNDFRITRVGRVLRKFSLDEIPQLVNVVRGEMSLVGPRPLPVHESAAVQGPHRRRFSMRPGITCLWQVNGRSDVDYQTWMNYDLLYVDGWSLALDMKLLLRTIPVVLSGRGAY